MAKNSKMGYTSIAKDMPCSKNGGTGVDIYNKVVGGGPNNQKTSKNGPGEDKNTGKSKSAY